jgi:CHC2 zinc finger
MSAQLENLLSHLDKVKRTGKDSYLACCPAHADKSPSLTVREASDGRILIHCFAGCDTESVLSSIGMTFDDLFPERDIQPGKPDRRPFEVLIVAHAGRSILDKSAYSEADQARLITAVHRIQSAVAAGGVSHV